MKLAIIASVFALGVFGLILIGGDSASTDSDQASTVAVTSGLTFQTIESEIQSGATLLDVRTPEEFMESHYQGAENHSLQLIESGVLPDVDPASKVYLYCRSGNRSAQAATLLRGAGYENIVDLGGLSDVQALGGTLIR